MATPTMSDNHDPVLIEQSLRLAAANKAIADADREGYSEISSGVYLNSKESITLDQEAWIQEGDPFHDYSRAPYWITTNDGQDPTPIYAADELVDIVDVDKELEEIMASADRRASLGAVAQDARPQDSNLASPEEALARRSRGRAM